MKIKAKKHFYLGVLFLTAFIIWTFLLRLIDVRAIGPNDSVVGFATINRFVHNWTGTNMKLYVITDWLGIVPLATAFLFAALGMWQWLKRRKISKVDYSLLVLGGFYIAVITAYLLFENVVVNYRPILIDGVLEASYPSSTTMLVLTVMPTAIMQHKERIKNNVYKKIIVVIMLVFILFMVIGRLMSGVHWFTDIIGGVLLSAGLVNGYRFVCNKDNLNRQSI